MSALPGQAKGPLYEVMRLAIAVIIALGAGFLLTLLVSKEPFEVYKALLTGGLPDISYSPDTGLKFARMTRFGTVLEDAITLTCLGLAIVIPFRAKQFSLGADGQYFLSALAASAMSVWLGGLPGWLIIPGACVAGFLWGLIPGYLKARFGANEIVTTLMLNVVALQAFRLLVSTIMRGPRAGVIMTPELPITSMMPILMARTHVTPMLLVAVLAAFLAWFLLQRTTIGYEIRVVGENPAFARQVGIPARRAVMLSVALGGAFAGLAGFHLSNGLLSQLPMTLLPGLGFEGIVVALLARGDPRFVPIAALLYAYLRAGAQVMERTTDVTREMVLVIQALIILLVVSEQFLPAIRDFLTKLRPSRQQRAA
jgi:ABC-type uncharacterized transport system permease subunit